MNIQTQSSLEIPAELIDAIRDFPLQREVEHCGTKFNVSPLEVHAVCPHCGTHLKLRSFSAHAEVEDIFDAVFQWMNRPGAVEIVKERQRIIAEDE